MRAYVFDHRRSYSDVIRPLRRAGRQAENAEMRRESQLLRKWLRADTPMDCRETDDLMRVLLEPASALERQHVRRIGDNFAAAQRREHAILRRQANGRARAERRDRRQFDRLELPDGREQRSIEFEERPLIACGGRQETIAFPLLENAGGITLRSAGEDMHEQ